MTSRRARYERKKERQWRDSKVREEEGETVVVQYKRGEIQIPFVLW
jgi:hypothetical protein